MLDLNTLIDPSLHITFTDAVGINDSNDIVAQGTLPNGDTHTMLLEPCSQYCRSVVLMRLVIQFKPVRRATTF